MKLFGYLSYWYFLLRPGKFNPYKASILISRHQFSSTKTREILQLAGASVGKDCWIRSPLVIEKNAQVRLGQGVFVNFGLTVVGSGEVSIGDQTLLGPHVVLSTVNHPLDPVERKRPGTHIIKNIVIGNNVWIGANVTISAGVHIGDNSVIGAGSVVTRDIPPNTLAVGVPCKPIRSLLADSP